VNRRRAAARLAGFVRKQDHAVEVLPAPAHGLSPRRPCGIDRESRPLKQKVPARSKNHLANSHEAAVPGFLCAMPLLKNQTRHYQAVATADSVANAADVTARQE